MSPFYFLAAIPTAPGAESEFPVWVLATWGSCLVFAGWVIYVLIREWRAMAAEEAEAARKAEAAALQGEKRAA